MDEFEHTCTRLAEIPEMDEKIFRNFRDPERIKSIRHGGLVFLSVFCVASEVIAHKVAPPDTPCLKLGVLKLGLKLGVGPR